MYCTKCGKEVREEARFCDSCGTAQGAAQVGASAFQPQVTTSVVVKPKRGGWLALKGFTVAVVLAGMGNAALISVSQRKMWTTLAVGVGAAYIISNLKKWSREKSESKGTGIAWTVATLMILSCVS